MPNESGTFAEFFSKREPLCGRINTDKIEFLFGQHARQCTAQSSYRSVIVACLRSVRMIRTAFIRAWAQCS